MTFRIDLKIFLFFIIFYFTNQIENYIIILISIIIHEFNHLIFGLLFQRKLKSITLMPIGFSIEFKICNNKEKRLYELENLIIEVAGPISNLLIILLTFIFNKNLTNIIYANLIIAIFNLLPIYPLDGGRILNSIFILVTNEENYLKKIMKISNITMFFISIITILETYIFKNLKIIFTLFYLWYILIREQKIYKQKIKIQKILKHL